MSEGEKSQSTEPTSDEGFGLVEIVVSMLILGLIAISFLPLLIQGVRVAAENKVFATATQYVHEQLEKARAIGTCTGTFTFGGDTSQPYTGFTLTRSAEYSETPPAVPCDIDYPGVLRVSISIEDANEKVLVEAVTLVLVMSEN